MTPQKVFGVRLPVLVEINVGQNRCGVEPGTPALALARSVMACRSLRFAGIQAYHGKSQHIYDPGQRAEVVNAAISLVRQTVDLLRTHGLECELVSGGGTGTYPIEAASGVYNEVQSGSYIFMDADYNKVRGDGPAFESALFVLTTVISRSGDRAVCDAGLKASSVDSGMPVVHDRPEIKYLAPPTNMACCNWAGTRARFVSAINSASSPVIATRPSTSTTGTSASAATRSRPSGRSPPEVPTAKGLRPRERVYFVRAISCPIESSRNVHVLKGVCATICRKLSFE